MWKKTLQVRLLIITLSFYRKRAKNIYIIKEHLTDSYIDLHFVVSDERIRQKEVFSQWASEENTGIWTPLIGQCIHKLNSIMCDWL